MHARILPIVPLLLLATLVPQEARAQSPWLEPVPGTSVYLEVLKADIDEPFDFTFLTTTWFLSGRVSVTDNMAVVAEVPFALAQPDLSEGVGLPGEQGQIPETELESQVGNVYLGVNWRLRETTSMEFGLRLPIVDSPTLASSLGGITDLVDRAEAFLDDILPIQMAINYGRRYESGLAFELHGSPVAVIDLDEFSGTQVYFLGAGQVRLEGEAFMGGMGLGSRININNINEEFGAISQHHLAFFGSYQVGRARPGLQLRLPLDDNVREIVDYVIAATVAVDLRGR